jgi:hypothetical protein
LVVFKVINLKRGKGKPMAEVIREGVARVGVDLAKRVIQVHVVDAHERVVTSKALRREQFLRWPHRTARRAAAARMTPTMRPPSVKRRVDHACDSCR